MALPANIRLKPLNGDDIDANGQGQIQQARPAIQQFLLNVFGAWNQNKPQLFKDVPAVDMVTPQIAYATGQGSAEESLAGMMPARFAGGAKYGRSAVNYGAQQGKQYAAREGQQFIKSQVENIVRNPTKAATPTHQFAFSTQNTAQPSAAAAMTNLSKAEAGSFMGGLKPGSVEPVIPWATKVQVAGIDAKNVVKQGAGAIGNKIMAGKNAVTSGAKTAGNVVTKNPYTSTAVGVTGLGLAGILSGPGQDKRAEYVTRSESANKQTKPVEQRTSQKPQPGDKNPSNQNSIYPNASRQNVKPDAKITGNTVPSKPAPAPVITTKTNTTKKTSDGTTTNTSKTTTTPVPSADKGKAPEVRKKESPNVKTTSPAVDKAVQQVAGPKPVPNTSALVDQAEQMEKVNANMPIKGIQARPLPNRSIGTKVLAGSRPQPTHNSTGNFYAGDITLEPNYIPGILNRGVKTQMKCGGVLKTKKKKK